jgi:hypothetical protein
MRTTNAIRRCSMIFAGLAWLALPGCSTQEISADPITYVRFEPGADKGALFVVLAPTAASYDEQVTRTATEPLLVYHLFMDGAQLVHDDQTTGKPDPILAYEGQNSVGFLAAGVMHHFEVAQAGGPRVFAGDAVLPPDSTTRLYLFGDLDALAGKFVSFPSFPAPDSLHVSVTNLVRSGPDIEVVSCLTEANCRPVSPALALGETFAGDFAPVDPLNGPSTGYALADGAKLGYRQVPTAGVPAPPKQPIEPGAAYADPRQEPFGTSANLVAAPFYMSSTGDVLWSTN